MIDHRNPTAITVVVPPTSREPMFIDQNHFALSMAVVERHSVSSLDATWSTPGVYILFGDGSGPQRYRAYVGKATSLRDRLRSHASNSEKSWRRALLLRRDTTHGFTSADIGWLEGRFWEVLNDADLAELDNLNRPGDSTLPPHTVQGLEFFIDPVCRVLRMLGFPTDAGITDALEKTESGLLFELPAPEVHAPAAAFRDTNATPGEQLTVKLAPDTPSRRKRVEFHGGLDLPTDTTDADLLTGNGHCYVVYIARAGLGNLRLGIERETWGFPIRGEDLPGIAAGDILVMAYGYDGGSPRVQAAAWKAGRLDRALFLEVTSPYYQDDSPLWPNQSDDNDQYRHRIGVRYLAGRESVAVGSLPPDVAEGLRKSAIAQGRVYRSHIR